MHYESFIPKSMHFENRLISCRL